jgi:predicted enzyme related to lactoylglutathione lyase
MIRSSVRMLLLAGALLAGCASTSRLFISVPPIASGGPRLSGKVVWHDLVTADMAGVQQFYAGVFGWQFEPVTDGYVLVRNGDRAIGGIAALDSATAGSQWLAQISVPDIAASAEAVRHAGGKVLLGPFTLRGRGQVAVVSDPQAAIFGMIQTSDGDPVDAAPRDGDWLWHEVWVADPQAAAKFYFPLFGYTPGTAEINGKPYLYFKSAGKARAGLVQKPDPKIGNAWVSYVRVADVDAVVARVPELGGRVLFAPTADVRKGSVAVIADPGGAGLLVQEWPIGGAS